MQFLFLWNWSRSSHTPAKGLSLFFLSMCKPGTSQVSHSQNDIDDNKAKSQVATTMTESSFLVEAMVRGYHVYKDIFQNFWPGSFFHCLFSQLLKIVHASVCSTHASLHSNLLCHTKTNNITVSLKCTHTHTHGSTTQLGYTSLQTEVQYLQNEGIFMVKSMQWKETECRWTVSLQHISTTVKLQRGNRQAGIQI